MPSRYVVLCPDVAGSSGGAAVLYDLVVFLRRDGHDVVLAHMSPSGNYPNTPHDLSAFYTRGINRIRLRYRAWPVRLYRDAQRAVKDLRGGPNSKLHLSDDDVLVVPDFWIAEAAEAFPRQRKILFVQNSFSLIRSYARAEKHGFDPRADVIGAIGISDTCMDALSLLGYDPMFRCPVAPNLSLFPFAQHKEAKIGYMPRKRPLEANVAISALERRGRLGRYDLVRIDGMTQPQVAEALRECLIFVSFMKTEALGFPAMEAMSAGCVVIGFTGLGTEEYFTPETGIPVPEGDLPKLVETIEATIASYDRDPTHFDQMRANASWAVAARYNAEVFETSLRDTWRTLASRI